MRAYDIALSAIQQRRDELMRELRREALKAIRNSQAQQPQSFGELVEALLQVGREFADFCAVKGRWLIEHKMPWHSHRQSTQALRDAASASVMHLFGGCLRELQRYTGSPFVANAAIQQDLNERLSAGFVDIRKRLEIQMDSDVQEHVTGRFWKRVSALTTAGSALIGYGAKVIQDFFFK
jgi:hypothetical protein